MLHPPWQDIEAATRHVTHALCGDAAAAAVCWDYAQSLEELLIEVRVPGYTTEQDVTVQISQQHLLVAVQQVPVIDAPLAGQVLPQCSSWQLGEHLTVWAYHVHGSCMLPMHLSVKVTGTSRATAIHCCLLWRNCWRAAVPCAACAPVVEKLLAGCCAMRSLCSCCF
jgi:hypothetical protein